MRFLRLTYLIFIVLSDIVLLGAIVGSAYVALIENNMVMLILSVILIPASVAAWRKTGGAFVWHISEWKRKEYE